MANTTPQSKTKTIYSPSVWRAMERQAKARQEQQQLKRIDSIVIAGLILEVVAFLIITIVY